MLEKIKNIVFSVSRLGVLVISILFFGFISILLFYGVLWGVERSVPIIHIINTIVLYSVPILLLLSVFNRLRKWTGTILMVEAGISFFILFLISLAITYQTWGFIGVFLGFVVPIVGTYITATAALFFNISLLYSLVIPGSFIISGVLFFVGSWIVSKHETANYISEVRESE